MSNAQATPARGGDELREAFARIVYELSCDVDAQNKHKPLPWEAAMESSRQRSFALADRLIATLASTDMAGVGEKTREALIATRAMYEDEIALLRKTLIAMGRMIPGVVLHDDVSSSFLALLPTELAAALASPKATATASVREDIGKFVDDFFAPWGSWKTAWWEGEVSDDAAFTAENALKHVANMARYALTDSGTAATIGGERA